MTTPMPGDFALTKIPGAVGFGIKVGQWLNGDGAPVQHALVYVGEGQIVQAMPGGAELIALEDAPEPVVWSTGGWRLSTAQRAQIAAHAIWLVGTPYSFADYGSLALARFHVRPDWVSDFVKDTGHMICSQLVDECYRRAGINLFRDGRLPGDVTPGDLWRLDVDARKRRVAYAKEVGKRG